MNTHRIHRQTDGPGTGWLVVPLLWAAVALLGCALIANWPGLFAEDQPAQAAASVTAPAADNASRLPPASIGLQGGASQEVAQHVDTF
ncbi:MAG: hypothetical protein ABI409_09015 [Ramlibacter sp.]